MKNDLQECRGALSASYGNYGDGLWSRNCADGSGKFSSVCAQSSATRSFVLQHLEALAILHKKQDR